MMRVACPSHFHMCWKRTCAFGMFAPTISAIVQVLPPSVLTSTREILPRPLQASPRIGHHPAPLNFPGYDGAVMIDFASSTKLNWRAVAFGSGSVYLDVSSRNIHGSRPSSRRRSHLMFALP